MNDMTLQELKRRIADLEGRLYEKRRLLRLRGRRSDYKAVKSTKELLEKYQAELKERIRKRRVL